MKAAVIRVIATTLTQAMILMAFVVFFALKYRQANRKFNVGGLKFFSARMPTDNTKILDRQSDEG